jgi:hypothetical protein
MTAILANRKAALEQNISKVCGTPLEITIRTESRFTLSGEGEIFSALEKAKAFMSQAGTVSDWSAKYDDELDMTFAWFALAAR